MQRMESALNVEPLVVAVEAGEANRRRSQLPEDNDLEAEFLR